jgi:hypothetical protein
MFLQHRALRADMVRISKAIDALQVQSVRAGAPPLLSHSV